MGRDGKPVPYDAFTVGPTNSQFVYLPSKTDMHIILYLSKLYIFRLTPPCKSRKCTQSENFCFPTEYT